MMECVLRYSVALLLCSIAFAQPPARLLSFGDSITEGYAASIADKRYVNQIADAKGWQLFNYGFGGSRAADQADVVFASNPGATDFVTYMVGTNDNWIYGLDPARTVIFQSAHMDEVAWLGLPASAKIRGTDAAVAYSGSWLATTSANGGYGIGKVSTSQGASLRFQVRGTTLLFGTIIADGNGGEFALSIDNVSYGAYQCYGGLVATHFNRTYAPSLIRIPNLTNGTHSVVATVTSMSSPTNKVFFEWAAGLDGLRHPALRPFMWLTCRQRVPRLSWAHAMGLQHYRRAKCKRACVRWFENQVRPRRGIYRPDKRHHSRRCSSERLGRRSHS